MRGFFLINDNFTKSFNSIFSIIDTMKFQPLLIFILFFGCKSSGNVSNEEIFTPKIIEKITKILNLTNENPDDNYIVHYVIKEENIRVISLQYCGTCYKRELMNQSKDEIALKDGRKIKILNKDEIDNFKPNPGELHKVITGGTYTIVTDLKGNIIESYIAD